MVLLYRRFDEDKIYQIIANVQANLSLILCNFQYYKMSKRKKSPSIIIADDHPLILEGLKHALEDSNVLSDHSNFFSLLRAFRKSQPELAILDVNMPSGCSVQNWEIVSTCRELRAISSSVRIILISGDFDQSTIRSLFENKLIDGFFLKENLKKSWLANVIELVMSDMLVFPQDLFDHDSVSTSNQLSKSSNSTENEHAAQVVQLTNRQQEIFEFIYHHSSESTNAIAKRLNISVHTVNSHLRQIYSSLSVTNKTAAIKKGLELGLLRNDIV